MTRENLTAHISVRVLSIAVAAAVINVFHSANTYRVHNSESVTISLGDFDEGLDDLEMIPESRNHALVNRKLEKFHEFVKNSKVMKHPWEKLFIKNAEYRKSEKSYGKVIQDTITKMKEFNSLNRKKKLTNDHSLIQLLKVIKSPYIDKRHLSEATDMEDDDDDDDDDEENENSIKKPIHESKAYKEEYEMQIHKDNEKEKAFKYSDQGKPEESAKEALEKIIDIKTPQNCSNVTGFGIQFVECLIKDYQTHEISGKEAISKFLKILLIWIDIYLSVAIPLWCVKGWCCCCITWEYCHPKKMVQEVRKYIAENPPGVYVNEDGEEEHYAPSLKEKELYDKINKKILRL